MKTHIKAVPARTTTMCDGCGIVLIEGSNYKGRRGWFDLETISPDPMDALDAPVENYDLCPACITSALNAAGVQRVHQNGL